MTAVSSAARPLFMMLIFLLLPTTAFTFEGFDPQGTGQGYPSEGNGRNGPMPTLPAHRITNGGIKVDGLLDEESWAQAPAGTGFTQYEPDRHGEPGEETVFKVVYDDDSIYFGVACLRGNGSPITSCLSRRDNITSSDLIRVYISPYHDLTTGYHFRINPHGVKEDYYNYGDLYHDKSWDAVWEANTYQDEHGWYAEIRIPFSSIRYLEADSMTWGFNVFQYIHSLGQRTAWSNWDRDQSGFMSRSGTVTGIDGIRPPRQLEVTPYVVGRLTDPADPEASGPQDETWDTYANMGADIKYGVTPDLTLSATIQPDFGQVEADPALLNLSPYETFYQEKRPFFIEGAQFFWHPDFTVFYSRRIGTGTPNSRIRAAAKLTGKVAGNVSTAVLLAATDETGTGQAHNIFKGGDQKSYYGIARFGRQFNDDQHSFHVMQTAVYRDADTFEDPVRNGYTTGADCELNFLDRMYQFTGSFVGSIVDPQPAPQQPEVHPETFYGTGSRFEFEKRSGDWRWALTTRHQSDQLDLNDIGYINDPNHYAAQVWLTRVFNSDDDTSLFTSGNLHARVYKSWIYAARNFRDPDAPGEDLWSYDRGHDLRHNYFLDGYAEFRSRYGFYWGANYNPEGTSIYETRWLPDYSERGPLMSVPANHRAWAGVYTDRRKSLSFELYYDYTGDEVDGRRQEVEVACDWVMNSRITHSLSLGYNWGHDDAQWIRNLDNPGGGIGNVSFTFGELDQQTWDLTLRSNILFERNHSLELYLQPFLTVGDYNNLRELARPDTYDLQPYDGYEVKDEDFSYAAVNLNLVYRWEYRPGSTIYLVWTNSRQNYDQRAYHGAPPSGSGFSNDFSTEAMFDVEPTNTFLIKGSYWFSL